MNKEGNKFSKKEDILEKIEVNGTGNTFFTLKDHKKNSISHLTANLINPSKAKIGRISKHILDEINTKLVKKLSVNGWKNKISVIKRVYKFLQFNINMEI